MAFYTYCHAAAVVLAIAAAANAYSLADIDHVVLFMQENRAFDHYFGTLAGVRGFSDPNALINSGVPVWKQNVNSTLTPNADYLQPWYINYEGGKWIEATQCMDAGSNSWQANHGALNGGLNNEWAVKNTPYSLGYYTRSDIPVHYGIADGWTIGDMYQEAVIASTSPNRATWISGTITDPTDGSIYIDNSGTPGCEINNPPVNCYPLNWTTAPEYYQKAGVSWQVYQNVDNFGDDPLAWFEQFQNIPDNSTMSQRGLASIGLDAFYAQAQNGTLPTISWIVGPAELSEHPPYSPHDGSWLQQQVIDAMTSSPLYNRSALFISWDETGGWADHVVPYHAPQGTAIEWVTDPYIGGATYTGPGFRLPFYIISPFTRGGSVFTEHADHNSQLLFLETWLAAKGYSGVQTAQMAPWRRAHMSNLVNAFDFSAPDFSIPALPAAPAPHTDSSGNWDGSSYCASLYGNNPQPSVPYGEAQWQPADMASLSEKGFKAVRGALTEGRYLSFETGGFALQNGGGKNASLGAGTAVSAHDQRAQLWVVHQLQDGGTAFYLSSGLDGRYLSSGLGLVNGTASAASVTVTYLGGGQGYSLQLASGSYLGITSSGKVSQTGSATGFGVFSVTGFD